MQIQAGATAEAYVYYRLLSWGYDVHFASGIGSSFDLWVYHKNCVIRLQVKGSSCVSKSTGSGACYNFSTAKGGKKQKYDRQDFDILALVALQLERAYFTDKLPNKTQKISPKKFDDDWEKKSWNRAFDAAIEGKRNVQIQRTVRDKPGRCPP